MNTCLSMMLLDSVIYFVLAWYISNVMPGRYGIAQKWYFPFTLKYWGLESSDREKELAMQRTAAAGRDVIDNLDTQAAKQHRMTHEPTSHDHVAGLVITNLSKKYPGMCV